jgi:hypothetical protein
MARVYSARLRELRQLDATYVLANMEKEYAVQLYRMRNPWSRVVRGTKVYGSTGCVRRVTCIYCDAVCTSSAKWPETKTSLRFRSNHETTCAREYIKRVHRNMEREATMASIVGPSD